jgi:hypothetical protein
LVVNNEQTTIFHLEICAFVYKINQLGPNFKSNQAPKFEEFSRIKGYIYIYNFILYFFYWGILFSVGELGREREG